MEAATRNKDVSEEFFKLCEGLGIGEMVTAAQFSLGEVMSAIELMEPKMDVGVGSSHLKTLDDAITEGLYADDMPMQIAVMDATLAMIVAWLEGSSLSATVWTNVMLAKADLITHNLFHAFCAGVNLLVRNIYSLVNNVGNLEELPEDFNPQNRFNETRWRRRQDVVDELRILMKNLEDEGLRWFHETGSRRATEVSAACCARLDLLANLLDIMSCLVPPEIDDPVYEHKIYVGKGEPISEKEYEILANVTEKDSKGNKGDASNAESANEKKKEQPVVQKTGKKNKGKKNKKRGVLPAKNNALDTVPEEKTPKDSPEKDSPKETPQKGSSKKGSPKNTPPKPQAFEGESSQKESPKSSSVKEEEQKSTDCCSEDNELTNSTSDCEDEEVDIEENYPYYSDAMRFQPNFPVAAQYAEKLIVSCMMFKNTVRFGRRGPDNNDGDYKWLMPFDQKACIKMIPACFPRNVKYPSREYAAEWWLQFAHRVHELTRLPAKTIKDINMLLFFAQQFNLKSCVLTRSLLQVIMFPVDSHILGGAITCAEPVEDSLRNSFMPQVLNKDSPVHDDPKAKELYISWLNQMSKLMITLYTSFGCNFSRQRDRLEQAIEELAQLQFIAGSLEERTDEVMIASKMIDVREQNPSYHSVATFVFHNVVATLHYYFELGFRMDLYVPYEYTYMFWFLGNIEAAWMLTTLERSDAITKALWKGSSLSTTLNQRRQREKQARAVEMERRDAAFHFNSMNQRALQQVCNGILKISVVLLRQGIIKMPEGGDDAERLRFERRFECIQSLGPPLNVTYDTYKARSGVDNMYKQDINDLIDESKAHFMEAQASLEVLNATLDQNRTNLFVDAVWSLKPLLLSNELLIAVKKNIVVCGVLKKGDLGGRRIEWTFSENLPMYPQLALVK